MSRVFGLGFGVLGSGFRVWGLGCRRVGTGPRSRPCGKNGRSCRASSAFKLSSPSGSLIQTDPNPVDRKPYLNSQSSLELWPFGFAAMNLLEFR